MPVVSRARRGAAEPALREGEHDVTELSFQDQMKGNNCWGCGPSNERGLRIKSYWSGDESVCTWQPAEQHSAAPLEILNGGVIATLFDCHCICTAVAAAYRSEDREIGSAPVVWYATGALEVKYLRPTPIRAPVTLTAEITEMAERKTTLSCSLSAEGEERATARLVAVRVPDEWGQGQ